MNGVPKFVAILKPLSHINPCLRNETWGTRIFGGSRTWLPGFPGGFVGGPEVFELVFVSEGVHGLPEAVVEEGVDFALGDEGFDGFALEHLRVVGDGVEDFGG